MLRSHPGKRGGRDRHERGTGCGGRGRRRKTNDADPPSPKTTADRYRVRCTGFGGGFSRTAKPCGPDAPMLASSLARFSRGDGGKKAGHQGEPGISRKAIAQGMPDCLRFTCMLVCISFCANRTRDRGCSVHPASPAPSSRSRGRATDAGPGRFPSREREAAPCRRRSDREGAGCDKRKAPPFGGTFRGSPQWCRWISQ
jgi:hypothetical protein